MTHQKWIRRRAEGELRQHQETTQSNTPENGIDLAHIHCSPEMATVDDVLQLQELVGNQATGQIVGLASPPVIPSTGYRSPKPTPPQPVRYQESSPDMPAYANLRRKLMVQRAVEDKGRSDFLTMGTAPTIQRTYEFGGEVWKEDERTFEKKRFSNEGDDGRFTAVQADSNLPTAYGVLKHIFGKNLNEAAFGKTKDQLGTNCDRPHRVKANITRGTHKKQRLGVDAAIVTAIGNLGDEELNLRDGPDEERVTTYHGGHLVGYQVLAGEASNTAWNVAPQDANNNQYAYNNTIEEMVRAAKPGTEYNYEVQVDYQSLNYRVNQEMLLANGIIKKLDKTKHWELQIPARIPQHWETTATMVNNGQFSKPSSSQGKTYEQLSQDMTGEFSHKDSSKTARYKLDYKDKLGKELEHKNVKKGAKDVKSVSFRMQQIQPTDLPSKPAPKDWGDNKQANFGEVKLEAVSVEKVTQLIKELKELAQKLDEQPEDVTMEEFSFENKLDEIFQFKDVKETTPQLMFSLENLIESNIETPWFQNYTTFTSDFAEKNQKHKKYKKKARKVRKRVTKLETDDISSSTPMEKLQDLKRQLLDHKREIEVGISNFEGLHKRKRQIEETTTDFVEQAKKAKKSKVPKRLPTFRTLKSVLNKRSVNLIKTMPVDLFRKTITTNLLTNK